MKLTADDIKKYRGMVVRAVLDRLKKNPRLVPFKEDLIQEGMLGLVEAAGKFDPSVGVKFNTYAWYHIFKNVRAGALGCTGIATGRRANGNRPPSELWQEDYKATNSDGEPLDPDEIIGRSGRQAETAETRQLISKLKNFLRRKNVAGTPRTKHHAQIYWARIMSDRSTCPDENDSLIEIGKRFGMSKQGIAWAFEKVDRQVKEWGAELLAEAA